MSKMLALIGAGWESIRLSASQGRHSAALAQATHLLSRPDLPVSVATQAHRLAGELLLDAEGYSSARRHLRAAAALEPMCATTFYQWGLAHERDPHGCDRRAALCFRRASALEAGNAVYRAAFGRAAVRAGRTKTGVRELLAAADAAPGDVPVFRVVTEGLIVAGRLKAASRVLTKARFLNPCNRELGGLWERVRFEAARKGQRERRGTTRHRHDAEFATDGGRVVLPFVGVADEGGKPGGGMLRRDVVSLPQPHFPKLRLRKADR